MLITDVKFKAFEPCVPHGVVYRCSRGFELVVINNIKKKLTLLTILSLMLN